MTHYRIDLKRERLKHQLIKKGKFRVYEDEIRDLKKAKISRKMENEKHWGVYIEREREMRV